jgi:hypothetical protein
VPKQRKRRLRSARTVRERKQWRFAEDQIRAQSSVRDDAMEHALKIKAAWQKAVASIIETGRLLIEAKKKLPPGVYGSMFGVTRSHFTEPLMPFSKRTAERLIRIASHKVLCDATHVSRLSPLLGDALRAQRGAAEAPCTARSTVLPTGSCPRATPSTATAKSISRTTMIERAVASISTSYP